MFYVYIVLATTLVLASGVYFLQLTFNLWGHKKRGRIDDARYGFSHNHYEVLSSQKFVKNKRKRALSKNVKCSNIRRKPVNMICTRKKKTEKEEEDKTEEYTTKSSHANKEEPLIILSNREPKIDKINTRTGEVVEIKKTTKERKSFLSKVFPCLKRKEKPPVNIPVEDWKGPVKCQVVKKVSFWTKKKIFSNLADRKSRSTHESVQAAWENSVKNHIQTRKAVINQSKNESFKTFKSKIMKGRKKFKTYSTEKLGVETTNEKKTNCKSIITISHVKKRRPQGLLKCYHCGAEGTNKCQVKCL